MNSPSGHLSPYAKLFGVVTFFAGIFAGVLLAVGLERADVIDLLGPKSMRARAGASFEVLPADGRLFRIGKRDFGVNDLSAADLQTLSSNMDYCKNQIQSSVMTFALRQALGAKKKMKLPVREEDLLATIKVTDKEVNDFMKNRYPVEYAKNMSRADQIRETKRSKVQDMQQGVRQEMELRGNLEFYTR